MFYTIREWLISSKIVDGSLWTTCTNQLSYNMKKQLHNKASLYYVAIGEGMAIGISHIAYSV